VTSTPLVSIVCLCYNHERFVQEAVQSVLAQTYKHLQVIIVDDASSDHSRQVIEKIVKQHPSVIYLPLESNIGNCAAFNRGFELVKGEFVVDFATDDVMLPDRIEKQVNFFSQLDSRYGVVFSDALYIDEHGRPVRSHFEYLFRKRLIERIPQGDIYKDILTTYFIPSPTMLVRTKVLKEMQGYDEQLSYEDFDFWVRSSRNYFYAFQNESLTRIRKSRKSMSVGWYQPGDKQLHSTYLVCLKAWKLNRSSEDHNALAKRVKYEIRQSVFSNNKKEAALFYSLLKTMKMVTFPDQLLMALNRLPLNLSILRRTYHRLRFG
jgi:glycosyltransferase involved in cell wall biosynthesis